MADDSWRTATFRQSVVSKIDEAIRQSRMPTSRNSMEMENHVFQKAKTKEEYLGFVARLILHVREMNAQGCPTDVDSVFRKAVDLPRNWTNEVSSEEHSYEEPPMYDLISPLPSSSSSSYPSASCSVKRLRESDQQTNASAVAPKPAKEVDEYDAFGIVLAAKLRQMPSKQRLYCEHLINVAVYKGMLEELTQDSVISKGPVLEPPPRNSSQR